MPKSHRYKVSCINREMHHTLKLEGSIVKMAIPQKLIFKFNMSPEKYISEISVGLQKF